MLLTPSPNGFGFTYDNYGSNPSTTYGGLVTASASANVKGSATVLATGANLSENIYLLEIHVHTTSGTGDRSALMDIGYDPAGGTSYTWVIPDIVVGNIGALTTAANGERFLFPVYIPSGSQVAARMQCSQVSITCRVAAKFYGEPSNPAIFPRGSVIAGFGSLTNSTGQSFTPGNAADGSWADLGATSSPLWWWQLSYQVSNATITAEYTYIDVAIGDASNKRIIMRAMHGGTTAELCSDLADANKSMGCFYPAPSGVNVYVRGRCNNAPDTGYNARVIGIGG